MLPFHANHLARITYFSNVFYKEVLGAFEIKILKLKLIKRKRTSYILRMFQHVNTSLENEFIWQRILLVPEMSLFLCTELCLYLASSWALLFKNKPKKTPSHQKFSFTHAQYDIRIYQPDFYQQVRNPWLIHREWTVTDLWAGLAGFSQKTF